MQPGPVIYPLPGHLLTKTLGKVATHCMTLQRSVLIFVENIKCPSTDGVYERSCVDTSVASQFSN